MVTNKERRVVAAKLREKAGSVCFTGEGVEDCIFGNWLSYSAGDSAKSYTRLANLIEPGSQCPYYSDERHWCGIHDIETERTCRIDMPVIDWETGETDYRCSSCGFSADPQDWAETYVYCPNCGARVV